MGKLSVKKGTPSCHRRQRESGIRARRVVICVDRKNTNMWRASRMQKHHLTPGRQERGGIIEKEGPIRFQRMVCPVQQAHEGQPCLR